MSLAAGTRLGPYEIGAPIGKGGMGEVYRARDTKLDRDVAIKVLPEEFAKDKERLARFEREAKLLASLNHPNIASIYGLEESDGVKALVLELVEGPTLAERIAEGPIPVEEALPIARQIAEALEAGHEAGVIHRDLKPANVKVKEDGTVKVLDYGLAKALEGDTPSGTAPELSQSPTLTRHGTQIGVILGTAAYMSPEQAKGRRLDRRADVWAFGTVVYEMLTGKRAFAGDDVSETLAFVLTKEPDWESIPVDTPRPLLQALRVCLTKEVKLRARDIADVHLAMDGAFHTSSESKADAPQPSSFRPGLAVAAALMLAAITGVAAYTLRPETPRPVARLSLSLPPGDELSNTSRHVVAISSDGTRIIYSARRSVAPGQPDHYRGRLYLREIDQMEATPIRGTEAAQNPFLSPDGEWVGFWSEGQLKKVAIRGGAPVSLCDATNPFGARWGADDTIVFGQNPGGILRVAAAGGTPEVLIRLKGTNATVHGPQILPGEKAVLFTSGPSSPGDRQIVVHTLETDQRKVLIDGGRDARYVPTGHLVYVSEGTLFAVPFDVDELEVTGGPIAMAEGVITAGVMTGAAQFSISDTGVLVYLTGRGPASRTLVWVDRNGREQALAAEPRAYTMPMISPDGTRLALTVSDQDEDIWIWDFGREILTRLTFSPAWEYNVTWTPDGARVAFASSRDGNRNIYWKAADGTGTVELMNESENTQGPAAFTPDGTQLLFHDIDGIRIDVGLLSLGGSTEPLLESEFEEMNAEISPNGRWLAYQSDASGQYEVYVRPFPNVEDGQWQISSGGGTRPVWSRDGSELFYLASGAKLMAVDVETESSFVPGNTEELFGGYYAPDGMPARTYDVSPDGERFLMIKGTGGDSAELVVVLNWFEELKRLVPTDH